MSTGEHAAYQQNWNHLMGALDELLEQARGNGSQLQQSTPALNRLLDEAGQQRDATEAAFRTFMEHRERLTHLLDQLQRELAVAGLPLKGDII